MNKINTERNPTLLKILMKEEPKSKIPTHVILWQIMNDHSGGFPRHFAIRAVDVGSREGSVAVWVNLVDACSVEPDLAVLLARTTVQCWGLKDGRIEGLKASVWGEKNKIGSLGLGWLQGLGCDFFFWGW